MNKINKKNQKTKKNQKQNRKLVFYMPGLVDGGAERVCALLASHFARRGDEVILAVDFTGGENAPELDAKVRLEVLGGGHLATIFALSALLRRERPDLVFTAIAGSNLKAVLANVVSLTPTGKTIIAYHGFDEHRYGWLSWLNYLTLPVLSRITARTICVSEGLKTYLIAKWHAARRKTIRIYNPVELISRNIEISKQELNSRDDLVLAVGRLSDEKNMALAIDALALMNNRAAKLLILGEGPQRARLEAQIARLGLQSRVSMPGFSARLAAHYATAKCLCLPSNTESFGNVVVEALGSGLGVVAANCAGPGEILDAGIYGTIVPRGDAQAMAAALDAVLADPGDPAPRQNRAAMFSSQIGCANYEALIDELLGSASKRP